MRPTLGHLGIREFKLPHIPFTIYLIYSFTVFISISPCSNASENSLEMFQLKCREAVCIPKGKSCEIDTALSSDITLYDFAFFHSSNKAAGVGLI